MPILQRPDVPQRPRRRASSSTLGPSAAPPEVAAGVHGVSDRVGSEASTYIVVVDKELQGNRSSLLLSIARLSELSEGGVGGTGTSVVIGRGQGSFPVRTHDPELGGLHTDCREAGSVALKGIRLLADDLVGSWSPDGPEARSRGPLDSSAGITGASEPLP